MTSISISKGSLTLAGLLYKPITTASSKTRAVIIVHPGGGVKEQTAALYATKLAEQGFTAVCYDASFQGESGGEPHFLEDPAERVSDVWFVVDYLQQQDFVDPDKIVVVGICAGGGYAVAAAKADHRLKAVATVSMVNIGASARLGWYGKEQASQHINSLEQAAAQLTAEAGGADRVCAPYVPPQIDSTTPADLCEANDYYLTSRAQHPRAENKMLFKSFPRMLVFDAFHLTDIFLTQPTLLIAGESAGSLWHSLELDQKIRGKAKKVILPNCAHMDLYDKLDFVDTAVTEIAQFFKISLV